MEAYEGIVDRSQVNDTGDYFNDFPLCIDYTTLENIFYKYKGKRVRVQIEVLPDTDEEE